MLSGFGNTFESEAKPGTLPKVLNNPQQSPHGLYAEQLSGSAFTAVRGENLRTWFYRIRPSVLQGGFEPYSHPTGVATPPAGPLTPDQMRWDPLPYSDQPKHFLDSWTCMAITGGPESQTGAAIYVFAANTPMGDTYFYNSDGELLIVVQEGDLEVRTECGTIEAKPKDIVVIPRGMKFQANTKKCRGYICENYGLSLRLPNLGPIGSNGLAQPRDFLTPEAAFEDKEGSYKLVTKFSRNFWQCALGHSPLDVVGWHGNYVPYSYNLDKFQVVNTANWDHPDPSIFTVLTSPSDAQAGIANVDFVIFPPRWMVAENTFRPPYYHRNIMSEYMGLIHGEYDAKAEGFAPGGSSLHNCMTAHGPDAQTFEKASSAELKPQWQGNTLAFMFETRHTLRPTAFALDTPLRQRDYLDCWKGLKKHFKG